MDTLYELVIIFPDNHMICLIEFSKFKDVGELVAESVNNFMQNGTKILVKLDTISGKCYFVNYLVQGFYFRGAQEDVTKQYQKRLLEIAERQVKASEKMVSDHDLPGDEWKKHNDNS